AVCVSPDRIEEWDWVKWLGHAQHPQAQDAAGASRLFGIEIETFSEMLDDELNSRSRFEPGASPSAEEPYYLVVFDGVAPPHGSRIGGAGYRCVTTILLDPEAEPDELPGLFLEVSSEQVHMVRIDRNDGRQRTALCRPDSLSLSG